MITIDPPLIFEIEGLFSFAIVYICAKNGGQFSPNAL